VLACVLALRSQGHVVLYINNPEEWLLSKEVYIINELIYAGMPLAKKIEPPLWLSGSKVESLFLWFCLLEFLSKIGDSKLLEKSFELFRRAFRAAINSSQVQGFTFLDQENTFLQSKSPEVQAPIGKDFPFSLRHKFGTKKITSLSANNHLTHSQNSKNTVECFGKMTCILFSIF